jgi:hypothetical protein
MRVYALYFRNKWILYLVAFEMVAGISIACVSAAPDTLAACMSISVVDFH